jgi:hypothetical protein
MMSGGYHVVEIVLGNRSRKTNDALNAFAK